MTINLFLKIFLVLVGIAAIALPFGLQWTHGDHTSALIQYYFFVSVVVGTYFARPKHF